MANKIFYYVLRILLGVLFIFSALAKIKGIDHFELYVFSFGWLPLQVSFILARLCIGLELALGVFLLLGWFQRLARAITLGLLIFFTLFLCYVLLVGRDDSCQCFGQLVSLSPAASLLKNAVMIAMVIVYSWLCRRMEVEGRGEWGGMVRRVVSPLLLIASLATAFIVSPPDNWVFGRSMEVYDHDELAAALAPDGLLHERGLADGHQLVAFVTPGCPYCKMAREKLTSIARRHHIDSKKITYLEPADLPKGFFLKVTRGSRPMVFLLDGGEVVTTYHYRNIDEQEVAEFLTGKK